MLWLHNKNGMFTVKSAYKVARKTLKGGAWAENSNGCARKRVWDDLWKLCLPNKIKVFGWRACHDILPTQMNLTKRRIITNNGCLIFSKIQLLLPTFPKLQITTILPSISNSRTQESTLLSFTKEQKNPALFTNPKLQKLPTQNSNNPKLQ